VEEVGKKKIAGIIFIITLIFQDTSPESQRACKDEYKGETYIQEGSAF